MVGFLINLYLNYNIEETKTLIPEQIIRQTYTSFWSDISI